MEKKKIKLMSFNTLHCLDYNKMLSSGEHKIDFQVTADAIKKYNPDIVGLNEIRDKGPYIEEFDRQPGILSELTGISHYYFAKAIEVLGENPYGNAILSEYPIISAETVPVPDPDPKTGDGYYESRCLLKAKLEGGITVLVIHFGLNRDEQQNAVDTVLQHIEKEKCILMGDFNVTPDNEVLKPIRERMKDAADYFNQPLLSFPSDKPEVKIDYIFVSPDIEVVSADIPGIVASDHRPHIAEITL